MRKRDYSLLCRSRDLTKSSIPQSSLWGAPPCRSVLALPGRRVYFNETRGCELNSLAGQLLVAMPQMQDHRFQRSVLYLCLHNKDGAMGLVLNKVIGSLTLPELLTQLKISPDGLAGAPRIHF